MSVPVDLGRGPAQDAAREELAKQIYQEAGPGRLERAVRWLLERMIDMLDNVAGASPGGYAGLALLILLGGGLAVAFRLGVGPLGRQSSAGSALFLGRPRSADEHRAAADAHAAAGDWAEAVRERLRAIVRSLEERGVLEPRAGRTADEAAAEAGASLPECAAGLRAAARQFDDIWYGGRPADASGDATLRSVDADVRAATPRTPDTAASPA